LSNYIDNIINSKIIIIKPKYHYSNVSNPVPSNFRTVEVLPLLFIQPYETLQTIELYFRFVIEQTEVTRHLSWSQLENGIRESEVERKRQRICWKSPPDRVGPDALEPSSYGAPAGGGDDRGVDGR
jgi:hypothetical protein